MNTKKLKKDVSKEEMRKRLTLIRDIYVLSYELLEDGDEAGSIFFEDEIFQKFYKEIAILDSELIPAVHHTGVTQGETWFKDVFFEDFMLFVEYDYQDEMLATMPCSIPAVDISSKTLKVVKAMIEKYLQKV